jgi:hypothetical protein
MRCDKPVSDRPRSPIRPDDPSNPLLIVRSIRPILPLTQLLQDKPKNKFADSFLLIV